MSDQKIALVTGIGPGIGKAVAPTFAKGLMKSQQPRGGRTAMATTGPFIGRG